MNKNYFVVQYILLLSFLTSLVFAGGGAENVLLVVNKNSQSSLAIANEYIYLRQIPDNNVVYLNIDDFSHISIDAFREKILLPLLNAINDRKIANQIDYIIYSSDFPWRVDFEKDFEGKKYSNTFGKSGSITGLTYLYQYTLRKDLRYLTLNSNLYYRKTFAKKFIQNANINLDEQAYSKLKEISELMKNKQFVEAETELNAIIKNYQNPTLFYLLAKCCARQNKEELGVMHLQTAVQQGWSDENAIMHDVDLVLLQGNPAFKEIINKIVTEKETAGIWRTQGFHSYYMWQNNGQLSVNPQDTNGMKYVISTMLGVTSGRGNSVEEVISSLNRSKNADFSAPKGSIYFMKNNDIRSKTRHNDFPQVVEKLHEIKVNAAIEEGTIPQGKNDVMGTVVGIANFSWEKSQSKILPGAICEHLTSYGGNFDENSGQTPISEFIRNGASGTSGAVVEPYALQAKFPTPWIQYHYTSGASLGEAFYQSLQGPYQLIILGDPLCQPWAKEPRFFVYGVEEKQTVKGKINLSFAHLENTILYYEIFIDGVMIARTQEKSYAFDSNVLQDGIHELRIVATAANHVQTQNCKVIPFKVQNHGYQVKLTSSQQQVTLGETLELNVTTNYGDTIRIYHNSQDLLEVKQGETIKIDTNHLGSGKVYLFAISYFSGQNVAIRSEKILLHILMPPEIQPIANNELPAKRTPGIKLIEDNNITIKEYITKGRGVLKVAKNKPVMVETYIDISESGIYQIQTWATGTYAININTKFFFLKDATRQSFLVHLKKGTYKLLLKGISDNKGLVDIKFGKQGTYSLTNKTCHIYE